MSTDDESSRESIYLTPEIRGEIVSADEYFLS